MERLFASIPGALNALGHNAKIDEAMVFAAWRSCAGEMLNERTAAIEFFENRLVVAVTDKTWRRHLEELSPQMLAKLNGRLEQGTVRFIEFVIDAEAVNRVSGIADLEDNIDRSGLSPDITRAADSISDEHLREQFIDAAAAYLAKQDRNNRR